MSHLEVVLAHCNIVKKTLSARFLYTFIEVLDISPKNYILLKTFESEFSYTVVWFTDQDYKPPKIEDKINIILVNN